MLTREQIEETAKKNKLSKEKVESDYDSVDVDEFLPVFTLLTNLQHDFMITLIFKSCDVDKDGTVDRADLIGMFRDYLISQGDKKDAVRIGAEIEQALASKTVLSEDDFRKLTEENPVVKETMQHLRGSFALSMLFEVL